MVSISVSLLLKVDQVAAPIPVAKAVPPVKAAAPKLLLADPLATPEVAPSWSLELPLVASWTKFDVP